MCISEQLAAQKKTVSRNASGRLNAADILYQAPGRLWWCLQTGHREYRDCLQVNLHHTHPLRPSCISIQLSVALLTTYFSIIVSAGLAAQEDGQVIRKRLAEGGGKFDIDLYLTEYSYGLLPPIRGVARS